VQSVMFTNSQIAFKHVIMILQHHLHIPLGDYTQENAAASIAEVKQSKF